MSSKTPRQTMNNMKGSGIMKKISSFILGIVMLLGCVAPVSAAKYKTTTATAVNFYVQRYGAQMDKEGEVSSQDISKFTPALFKSNLRPGYRYQSYNVVYREGKTTSDDVIAEVIVKPDDAYILEKIKSEYEPKGGQVLSTNGKVVSWENFDTDKYEMRWYVLKYEKWDAWHIDGVIVEKVTQLPIEIPLPGEPDYVEPDKEPEVEPEEPEQTPEPEPTQETTQTPEPTQEPEQTPEPTPEETPDNDNKVDDDNNGIEDVPELDFMSRYAYIFGYNDSTMAPEENLIRAEVSSMVYRLVKQNKMLGKFSYNESAPCAFDDIEGEWFRSGIEYMNYKGAFATGAMVHPYVAVTRGESFKIICLGLNFTDKKDLSNDEYAAILYNAGYIEGDENGNLNVGDLITRAEFCSIYNRIIGRENANLFTSKGEMVTAETYGITDLSPRCWYYKVMLRATSAYDRDGYVDIEMRNNRNILDDYQ